MEQALAERARTGEDRQRMLEVILGVLADESIPDEVVGGLLRDRPGRQNLADAQADVWADLPRDHGRLRALAASYPYLRQFRPDVLAAIDFHGGPGMGQLMEAVSVLRELNRSGRRKVPQDAPTGFVPRRYAGYLARARRDGDDAGCRHYWELLHSLRRDLHYANQGSISKTLLPQQTEHAWCLTVLTNAVVTWTTEHYALAVARLRSQGRDIPDDLLTHISPTHSQNVNYFGIITVDIEAELAKPGTNGHRPLRT